MTKPRVHERFLVPSARGHRAIRAADVEWIESTGNYVRLHIGTVAYTLRGSLTSLIAQIDPQRFVRIHRSYVVNLDFVYEVQPWFARDAIVLLTNGTRLRLSRSFRGSFERRFGPSDDSSSDDAGIGLGEPLALSAGDGVSRLNPPSESGLVRSSGP